MKILILSDLHGNAEALDAVLAIEPYDELWVLGDLVTYGPEPERVVRAIRERAEMVVRGNHDHAVGYDVDPRCSPPFRGMAEATRQLALKTLSDDDRRYLRELPLTASAECGSQRFFLCHATPSDPLFAYCPPDSPAWVAEASAVDADVILVGHTHLPFIRPVEGRTVINPGSLGQPKAGGPEASYAVWDDGRITLRKIKYPVERTVAKLGELGLPAEIVAALRHLLETGTPATA
ncbi:MAG TPA: metallophosphoesterase family protein [Vicinamibacterales bacterium]|jgi:protein phosphatase